MSASPPVEVEITEEPSGNLGEDTVTFSIRARATSSSGAANYWFRAVLASSEHGRDEISAFLEYASEDWSGPWEYVVIPDEVNTPDGTYSLEIIAEEALGSNSYLVAKTTATVGSSSTGGSTGGTGGSLATDVVSISNFDAFGGEQIVTLTGQVDNESSQTVDVTMQLVPTTYTGGRTMEKRVTGGGSSSFNVTLEFDNTQDITDCFGANITDARYV